jgi:hypothetical protein
MAAEKEFITLPKRTATAKLGAAKRAVYYYQPLNGIHVEREADVGQVTGAFAGSPRMRLRVRLSDSQHFIVVVDTKRLRYVYRIDF